MTITIDRWQPDGMGGYLIEWTGPAVLHTDGTVSDITAIYHLTSRAVRELAEHHCRPNRRRDLDDDLCQIADQLDSGDVADPDDLIRRWARCYGEIIADRIDRQRYGLRAVTPRGHADLDAARRGEPVPADYWDPHSVAARQLLRRFADGSPPTGPPASRSDSGPPT